MTDDIGWEQSTAFKEALSIGVDIEFVGVWDTVDSVGVIPKRPPFTSNTIVPTLRHAASLDERRAKFKANLWNRQNADEAKLGAKLTSSDEPDSSPLPFPNLNTPWGHILLRSDTISTEKEEDNLERTYSGQARWKTQIDVEEVWFAGCHADRQRRRLS